MPSTNRNTILIYPLFFLSGFPALFYQLIWQRALFTIYGIDIKSVTIVVAGFMLGLGLGSLLGGWLSKIAQRSLLKLFGCIELAIGLFGVISLTLFAWVGEYTLQLSELQTALVTFALVCVPTILMGATLPLLSAYWIQRTQNVGRSVGLLYFVNTYGSALACCFAAAFIMKNFGEHGTVRLAAIINIVIGISVLLITGNTQPETLQNVTRTKRSVSANLSELSNQRSMQFYLALILAILTGYISLSYEILWIRAYTFMLRGSAMSFAIVLGIYLMGIAFGGVVIWKYCKPRQISLSALSVFILLASMVSFFVAPSAAYFATIYPVLAFLPLIIATIFLGAILPLICHCSLSPDDNAGAGLSYIYFFNVIGAVAGTIITGFLLLDIWSIAKISLFLCELGFLMTAGIVLLMRTPKSLLLITILGLLSLNLLTQYFATPLFEKIYERLQYKYAYNPKIKFTQIIENKHGVITVTANNMLYGGGVYDGVYHTSLVDDQNLLIRAYALSLLHPNPKQVLMIGLGSGSWAQVVAHNPNLEHLTIIEINPGYVDLLKKYPQVASVLNNPKVTIIIDDGRRWLMRHPENKFDVIIMNTSFHWRAHASTLLSVEFLQMVRRHLENNGMVYYNTTWSKQAQHTALTVYPYVVRVINFIAASDSPINLDKPRWRTTLLNYRIDGQLVFDLSKSLDKQRFAEVLALADTAQEVESKDYAIELHDSLLQHTKNYSVVTNDNMATEWP